MLYLILGAFFGLLIYWTIEKSRWNRQFTDLLRSKVTTLAITIAIIALYLIGLSYLLHQGSVDWALRTQHIAGPILFALAGLVAGIIFGYCIRTRRFNFAHLTILVIFVVLGAGPQYWREWMTLLGVTKIGEVEFTHRQFDSGPILFTEFKDRSDSSFSRSDSSFSISDLSELFHLQLNDMIVRDNKTNELIGHQSESHIIQTDKLKESLHWLTRFARCISEHKDEVSHTFSTTSVRSIVKPVALGFYEILNLPLAEPGKPGIEDTITIGFQNRLIAAYSNVNELSLDRRNQNLCSFNTKKEDFKEQLNFLVETKSDYPYANLGLAYLLKVGELDVVDRVFHRDLDSWIGHFRESNSWNTRTMNYIVRAYSFYDLLMAVDSHRSEYLQDWLKIRYEYLIVLQTLLRHAAQEGALDDDDPNCKSSENNHIKRMIIVEIFVKNNLAELAGRVVTAGHVYRNEELNKHLRKASISAEELLRYADTSSARNCLDSENTGEIVDYLRATFLDTHASVTVKFAKNDYDSKQIGDSELTNVYKYAISIWHEALIALDQHEATTNDIIEFFRAEALREVISEKISTAASAL